MVLVPIQFETIKYFLGALSEFGMIYIDVTFLVSHGPSAPAPVVIAPQIETASPLLSRHWPGLDIVTSFCLLPLHILSDPAETGPALCPQDNINLLQGSILYT